jgi:hypothetical protein
LRFFFSTSEKAFVAFHSPNALKRRKGRTTFTLQPNFFWKKISIFRQLTHYHTNKVGSRFSGQSDLIVQRHV